MSQNILDALTGNDVEFGAQASGTDVILNSNQETSTVPVNSMLVYSEHHGLYGGAVTKAAPFHPTLRPIRYFMEKIFRARTFCPTTKSSRRRPNPILSKIWLNPRSDRAAKHRYVFVW